MVMTTDVKYFTSVVMAGDVDVRFFCYSSLFVFSLTFDATVILVNSKSWWTKFANGQVIFNDAGSVAGAALADTGIDALVVDASLIDGTASVLETNRDARLALRVTDAYGLVLQSLAGLSGRARAGLARVLTRTINACQVQRAFRISSA